MLSALLLVWCSKPGDAQNVFTFRFSRMDWLQLIPVFSACVYPTEIKREEDPVVRALA